MTTTEQPAGPTPDERRGLAQHIEAQVKNSRPTSWYDMRVTREGAAEWLGWSEDKLAEVDEILARNDLAKRAAATRRRQAQDLQRETDRVVHEMKQVEEQKLRAKAEKIARQRLGM